MTGDRKERAVETARVITTRIAERSYDVAYRLTKRLLMDLLELEKERAWRKAKRPTND